jgi:hypothetical protein
VKSGAFLEHIILPCKDRSDKLFDAEPKEGKEFESLDSVILFLKEIGRNVVVYDLLTSARNSSREISSGEM